MAIYLGPLGGLTEIDPLTEIEMPAVRKGGVHTALTGRRTIDYFGTVSNYKLRFQRKTADELAFLEALHQRLIPGPLRLVLDSLRKNRLSKATAATGYGGRDYSTIDVTAGLLDPSSLWPSQVSPRGSAVRWSLWGAGSELQMDREYPAPVVSGEDITASVHVYSPAADAVFLKLDHYGTDGYTATTAGSVVTLTANTWTKLTVTALAAETLWAASPSIEISSVATDSPKELYVAAPQVEPGVTGTSWQQGGAAPVVGVDQMPTNSPYQPWIIPELTLLEL